MPASRKPQQYPHLFPVPYPEFLPGDPDNRRVITPGPGSVPAENRRIHVKLLSDQKMVLANTLPKLCLRKSLVGKRPFFHLPGPPVHGDAVLLTRNVNAGAHPAPGPLSHPAPSPAGEHSWKQQSLAFGENSVLPVCSPILYSVNSGGNSWL